MAQRAKTISYRRAEWFGQGSTAPPLENCLRQSLSQLKTIDERTIFRGGQNAKVAKLQNAAPGGLLLHLATETPGEAASVIPKVTSTATEIDLRTQSPPNDGEWLDGDAFVLIHDNHVCLCTTALHETPSPHSLITSSRRRSCRDIIGIFFCLKPSTLLG